MHKAWNDYLHLLYNQVLRFISLSLFLSFAQNLISFPLKCLDLCPVLFLGRSVSDSFLTKSIRSLCRPVYALIVSSASYVISIIFSPWHCVVCLILRHVDTTFHGSILWRTQSVHLRVSVKYFAFIGELHFFFIDHTPRHFILTLEYLNIYLLQGQLATLKL